MQGLLFVVAEENVELHACATGGSIERFHTVSRTILLLIPERVWRPSAAREALGFRPLMEAGGGTLLPYRKCSNRARSYKTIGLLWGRPTAKRAADARTKWLPILLLLNLAIQNTGTRQ
jgi:hypothetical protein